MFIVVSIFLLYIILLQNKEKAYVFIYNFAVIMYGVFICAKLGSPYGSMIYHIVPFAMLIMVIPYIKKYISFIIYFFSILFIYILFKKIYWDINWIRMFMDLRISILALCMGLAMIEYINSNKLNINLFVKGIYILLLSQIFIGFIQYYFPSVNSFFIVEDPNAVRDTDQIVEFLKMNLVTGTFMTPSVFAVFSAISFFTLFTYELNNSALTVKKWIFFISLFVVLFFTGIRTPFILLVLFLFIYIFCFKKKLLVYIAFFIPILLNSVLNDSNINDVDGAIGRMLQGFQQASTGIDGLSESTFGYTFIMFTFFIQNPIFGISQYDSTISQLFFDGMSKSDVYLFYILCEYGLVGLLIFIYPFIKFKSLSRKTAGMYALYNIKLRNSIILLYLFFGLFLSVVDNGIFHYTTISMIVCGIVLNSCQEKNCDFISVRRNNLR